MRRLKVLVLIDKIGDAGGAERAAVALAANLPDDRFEVLVCSTRYAAPEVLQRFSDAGVRHLHLGRKSKWDMHRFLALARLLRREPFDILHSHMFGSNFWGTLIGRACGVPVLVAHEHSWSYEGEPVRRWLDGHVIGRLTTRFVAVSSVDAERMVSLEGVPPEKVVVLPNAYVPSPLRENGDVRRELGIGHATPLVAVVAVLRPEKALSVLLDAHRLVLKRVPDVHLVIAGHGPCREELETRTRDLGLEESVHFLGRRRDVDAILTAADVAAMSSDREGSPLLAFECMANGIPLVATAVGGLPDIVDSGSTGVLVPPRDPAALAGALVELLEDPAQRERMASAAAQRLSDFTLEAAIERLVALYEGLAATAGILPAAQPAGSHV